MKKYELEAIVDGKEVTFNHDFDSRISALNFIFNYYNKRTALEFVVNDEFYVRGDKHNIEYVNDYSNRFRISRKSI